MNNKKRKIKSVASPVMKAMITAVYVAGVAGVVIVAPNALQALEIFSKKNAKIQSKSKKFHYYAKNAGYFTITEVEDGKYAITLTEKGNKAATDVLFEDFTISKLAKWDKKWRIVMFDIAEKDRLVRDKIRYKINQLGMLLIQNSVYVYPYPVDEFIDVLHSTFGSTAKRVITMTADKIDGEEQLVTKFKNNNVL